MALRWILMLMIFLIELGLTAQEWKINPRKPSRAPMGTVRLGNPPIAITRVDYTEQMVIKDENGKTIGLFSNTQSGARFNHPYYIQRGHHPYNYYNRHRSNGGFSVTDRYDYSILSEMQPLTQRYTPKRTPQKSKSTKKR